MQKLPILTRHVSEGPAELSLSYASSLDTSICRLPNSKRKSFRTVRSQFDLKAPMNRSTPKSEHSKIGALQNLFLGRDAIQVLVGANEDFAIANRRGGAEILGIGGDAVDSELIELLARSEHIGLAVPSREIQLAIC